MGRREKKPGLFSTRNIVALFIVAVMVLSGLGYMMERNDSEDAFEYNGYKFDILNNMLTTKVGNMKLTFFSDPRYVDNINISPEILPLLKNSRMIYFTYNDSDILKEDVALVHYTIAEPVWKSLNLYVVQALTDENEYNYPVITCANATSAVPVIYFIHSNATGFVLEGNCVIANAFSKSDVYVLTDRLLFGLYGIMK
ncbi:hypothetical protein JXA85_01200 [Candidatus Woesearchaeota archaeon]|nr:hypothetical protein [Candidatus Woesearchaeota archaeon]